jgi:hypothetical protein
MSTSKHPQPGHEPDPLPADDLRANPGIGSSRGTTASGIDPEELELDADNTSEGDVANDAAYGGGIDPDQRGRTNK